jgi:hypothetical protein
MAKLSTVSLDGASGRKYIFDTHDMNEAHESVGGIYVVTKRYKDSDEVQNHKVIYIGQTSDLSTEFDNHPKADCFSEHEANCICTLTEKDERTRESAVRDLTKYYDRVCND